MVYGGGGIVFDTKRSIQRTQWMQRMQYTVCSRIVVYGGGDIVLWCRRVKPVEAEGSGHSGIVIYGGGDIVLWCKRVKPVEAECSGHSGIVIYGGGDIVFGAKRSN